MYARLLAAAAAATVAVLVNAGPAAAATTAAKQPTLAAAVLDVRPDAGQRSASVREQITVAGVGKGDAVRNVLARFAGVRVSDLTVTVAGQPVSPERGDDGKVTTVSFPAPASGKVRYAVTYQVRNAGGTSKLPLLVPAYPGTGGKVVTFRYRIPDGYHLRGDPFPVDIGSTGTQTRMLVGVPTFLDYRLGTSPPGPVTPFNVVAIAVIALIVVLSAVVFRYEARVARRGEVHV